MSTLETISLTQLTDEGWQKYCDASSEIFRLYYPEQIKKKKSWQEFKKEYLSRVEENKENQYNEEVIFDNGNVAGWYDYWLDPVLSHLGFNYLYDIIPDNILKIILNRTLNVLCEHKIKFIYHSTSDQRKITVMNKINAGIVEEFETNKLERSDMNTEMYDRIIKNIKLPDSCKLNLYNEFPEHLTDGFIEFENTCIEEINKLNPCEIKIPLVKRTDINRQNLYNKNNGIGFYYYVLSDENENIIAVCSVMADVITPDTIRHIGGLTAVSKINRGKGYGKFLKAKMYKMLIEVNKDFKQIITDTMAWNLYMYRINKEFGYIPFKNGYTYKLSKEFLENYLNG